MIGRIIESKDNTVASTSKNMSGRICMITGASSGIGKAAALELARLGATVVLVCRDRNKGESVVDEIVRMHGNRTVDLFIADLSSQESIRSLAREYINKYDQLHVLINNAGVYFTKRRVTVDGIEMMFAVNYLSRFLLTNLLLDVLKKSEPARIINVSGSHHSKGTINFDDLQWQSNYSGSRAIAQSKLAEVLSTHELARRLEGTAVTVNSLHPGVVATGLIDKDEDFPRLFKYIFRLIKPFLRSPEKGAETVIYLASSTEVEGVTGQYFVDKRIHKSSPESYDVALAQRLWDVSMTLTNLNAG
jgi:NAD(P)-dependent dehydrogenase (short-subunit alcohol dehydrogenase family)